MYMIEYEFCRTVVIADQPVHTFSKNQNEGVSHWVRTLHSASVVLFFASLKHLKHQYSSFLISGLFISLNFPVFYLSVCVSVCMSD